MFIHTNQLLITSFYIKRYLFCRISDESALIRNFLSNGCVRGLKSEIFVFVRPKSSVQVFILNFRNELMYFIFNGALCLPTYSSSLLKNFVSDIISHCTFLSILSKTTVFRNIKNNKILKIFKLEFSFMQKAKYIG